MKKTFRFISGFLALITVAFISLPLQSCDDDDDPHPDIVVSTNDLPKDAQNFLNKFYNGVAVRSAERDFDTHTGSYEYDVHLANGHEVTFSADGLWMDVDAPAGQTIPDGIVLVPINEYVLANYPGYGINDVSRIFNGYEVELTNGVDLIFDAGGQFMHVDR